jgi:hypothetical protein
MDLMIGDFVQVNGEVFKVISISYFDIGISDSKEDFYHEHIDNIKPIPLNIEILEKNGFVKYNEVSDTPPYDQDEEGNMYYSFKGEHKFWGWWQPNNVYYIPINAMLDLEIKYVHQLQHAMRLCGINKEITV